MMFFLPWWTYVLIGTVAFVCSFGAVWLANIAQPGVEQPDDGPFPCFAWLGHDGDGLEMWCWLRHGHSGRHEDQSELPETVFTEEWPEEDTDVTLPALPQRVSKLSQVAPCVATFADPCPPAEHECWDSKTGCTRYT